MTMIARIQQGEDFNSTLPYPYFIDEEGFVGRQDIWKGKPYKLLGFHDKPVAGDIKLRFSDFKNNIKKAIGMYPVFINKNNSIVTHKTAVESIEV